VPKSQARTAADAFKFDSGMGVGMSSDQLRSHLRHKYGATNFDSMANTVTFEDGSAAKVIKLPHIKEIGTQDVDGQRHLTDQERVSYRDGLQVTGEARRERVLIPGKGWRWISKDE
jgi:hypothetical protein